MVHLSGLRRATLVASLVLLAAPAAAAAGVRQFVVGPITVRHGYVVEAFRNGCGRPQVASPVGFGDSGVAFIKSVPGGTEVHTYYGSPASATCDFHTGRFNLSLGRLATIDVTFHPHGRTRTSSLPTGCGGHRGVIQPGTTSGMFRVDIDRSYFGSMDLRRARGSIATEGSPACNANVDLLASFGSRQATTLDALASPPGRSWLTIESFASVNRAVESRHVIDLTGRTALFDPAPDLRSATVNGPGGPVTGQLSYHSGTLSGSLKVAFDVIGTKILTGSPANHTQLFLCGFGTKIFCF